MKKITLLILALFVTFSGYSQWTEDFESGIPATWTVFDNAVGTGQSWGITTTASDVNSGTKAAQVREGQIGIGNISEDWLVTPLQTGIISNAQLRFFTRSKVTGNQGTLYQIRISSTTATGANDVGSYTILQQYTELDLSAIATVYEEKVLSLAAFAGQNRYIAFVRVHTQIGTAASGDRWLLDDVKIAEQCINPTVLTATNITSSSAVLGWTSTAPAFDVEYGPQGFTQGTGTTQTGVPNPYTATSLTPSTPYQFYVRANCASGTSSAWVGPFNFNTKFQGTICSDPYIVGALPYQVTGDTTSNYGNNITGTQGMGCGATPAATNFLGGNDVVYSYTPTFTGPISITLTPTATSTNSSLFVYNGCANLGVSCIAGLANTGATVRVLNINVTAGQTYIIVISSSTTTPTIVYDLLIQREECTPKPTALIATGITTTTASLSWTSAILTTGITPSTWEVAVQPLGDGIPTGAGAPATNPYPAGGLTAATQYQYWVRAECSPGSGVFTAWAGPFAFNTTVCEAVDQCNFTFRMGASVSGGWNGARMQVRQNGIVVGTIGSTFITGVGPSDVIVPLCKNIPFDLFWSVAGTQPQRCKVDILNSFGQTIYSKAAATGAAGDVLYSETSVNCTTPRCDLPPTALTATLITTNSATLSWTAVATTTWDVYIVPTGSPAPTQLTTPTYANVTTNPFLVTIPLLADTAYSFYVRVVCSPIPSTWTGPVNFTTIPTCPKPTGLFANTITTTSASLGWTNGTPTDTAWQILLVPTPTSTPPAVLPPANPTLTPGMILVDVTTPSPYPISTLTPATIYYYYIRTVCSTSDSSTWAGPYVFNTVTCAAADKCGYKFLLTDAGANGWNGGTMQVRQNGIVVATIGATITGAGPTTVTVQLCTNVPFDLYWNTAGTAPTDIALTIQNPFLDLLYTKLPGEGAPQTVLFSSVANCTPPTCQKPTTLNVTSITQTTATLGWTEVGTATQWQVYCVPVGSPAPINGSAVNNTPSPPNYVTTSNPASITGLTPGTAYTFYVRAICSETDRSTWTLLTPVNFTTKPANDECAFATSVPVNPTRICNSSVDGNTLGASGSLPLTSPVCTGNTDDDIWYSFVATDTTHIITLSNIVGGTTDLNHTVYSGNNCSSLTQLYCSNPNVSVAVNLVPGNTYKIRVYTNGALASQTATFTICITTPESILNDNCSNATIAQVNNGLECVVTTPGSLTGATGSVDSSTCIGAEDDDVWFSFVATATQHYFSLVNVSGSTIDLNHAVYSGSCGSLVLKYCSAAGSLLGNNATFVIGQTYYVRVWSNSNVPQDVTFNLCIGRVLPPITTNITQYTATELVEDVLLNTTCASVTNVTYSTGTNFGSFNGIGYFDQSLSEFPFQNGVILSTGNALNAPGPNLSTLSDGVNAWIGDANLEAIILASTGQAMNSKNATKLEFDFVPLANNVSFDFIFASEEYGTFQCAYSDAFAFLLTNVATGVTTNLALVPGTTDPISVVNVRNQLYNNFCLSVNPAYFGTFFGNLGTNPIGASINFNGMTVPMTAFSIVIPGVQYHIKMVIADRFDTSYDSAVFLKGGSFNIGNVELGDDLAGQNALCQGGSTTLVSGLNPSQYAFSWTLNGILIPNQTGPNLVVNEPGLYGINAQFGTSTCFATDTITVEFFQDSNPGTPNNLRFCDASGTAIFDLTQNTATILNPYTTPHTLNYFLNATDATNGTNSIASPSSFQNTSNPQTIYVGIRNSITNCYQTTSFEISVQDLTPQFTTIGSTNYCPSGSTTISVVPINNSFDTSLVTYIWTLNGNVIAGQNASSLPISTSLGYGTYTVSVNNGGCIATQTFVITNSNSVWNFVLTAPTTMCPNETGTLSVNVTNNTANSPITYTYTLPNGTTIVSTNSSIPISATGNYSVNVDILGCSNSQSITVGQSVSNWNFVLTAPTTMCPNETGTLSVNVTNNTANSPITYTYTLPNGTTIVSTNSSIPISATGNYSVNVDILGCSNSQSITVGQSVSNWNFVLTAPTSMCPNETGTLSVNVTNNTANSPITYTYTLPNGTTIVSANSSIPISATGNYSVNVDILGCSNSQSITVGQSVSNWNFILTAPTSMCPNETGTLSVNVTNNTANSPITYTYTLPNGTTIVSTNSSIPISATGIYSVNVDILGCSNSQSITVGQSVSNWNFVLTAPTTMCPNETGTLSVNVTNNTANSPVTYTYTLPNGTTIVSANSSIPISATGIYSVNVDILGCSNSQSITVGQSVSNWNFVLTAPTTMCPNETGTLSVNVTNNTANSPVTYTYTLPNGTTIVSANSSIPISATGIYSVNVDILGCSNSQSITVGQSVSNWNFTFNNEPYSICPNQMIQLSFSANNFNIANPNAIYTWTDSNGTQTTGTTLSTNQIGDYSLEVDILGCKSTKNVTVAQNTTTVAINVSSGCYGNQYKLEANPINNSFDPLAVTYTWTGPSFVSIPASPNAILVNESGSYTVKITTPDGCSSEETVVVQSTLCIIQKGISPNGDGDNDTFILTDVKKLSIYNRYGSKVYSYREYTNQWHGQTDGGAELPDGTYYYVIERGSGTTLTGWIYINK